MPAGAQGVAAKPWVLRQNPGCCGRTLGVAAEPWVLPQNPGCCRRTQGVALGLILSPFQGENQQPATQPERLTVFSPGQRPGFGGQRPGMWATTQFRANVRGNNPISGQRPGCGQRSHCTGNCHRPVQAPRALPWAKYSQPFRLENHSVWSKTENVKIFGVMPWKRGYGHTPEPARKIQWHNHSHRY